jgi:hypothetical protein
MLLTLEFGTQILLHFYYKLGKKRRLLETINKMAPFIEVDSLELVGNGRENRERI